MCTGPILQRRYRGANIVKAAGAAAVNSFAPMAVAPGPCVHMSEDFMVMLSIEVPSNCIYMVLA